MVPSPQTSASASDPAVAGDVLGVGTGSGHCLDARPDSWCAISCRSGSALLRPVRAVRPCPPRVSAGSDSALRLRSICWISRYRQAGRCHPALRTALQRGSNVEPDCQDIRGGRPARVVTQMCASRSCKRAVDRKHAAGVPARRGRPSHGLVQYAPGPARGRRYSVQYGQRQSITTPPPQAGSPHPT